MREIRLKVSELFEVDARSGEDIKDLVAITAYVLKHYAFLPKPIIVTLEGDDVLVSVPEEPDAKKEEAARLADRAVKRASEGNYEKAIAIYKRVLELQPSFHSARRDLAMAYVELGDVESATNHLIEVITFMFFKPRMNTNEPSFARLRRGKHESGNQEARN